MSLARVICPDVGIVENFPVGFYYSRRGVVSLGGRMVPAGRIRHRFFFGYFPTHLSTSPMLNKRD